MTTLRTRFRKATSLVMSALLSLSVFSMAATLQTQAVSYSEMSALDSYAYSGNDLGATYSKTSTTFKVWAPTASQVQIKRYKTGSDAEAGAAVIETKDMTKGSQGVWSITISGDLNGTYYTYLVTCNGTTKETVDIYARTTGVNGMRGMVLDLDSTDPVGWENDQRVSCPNQTDAIIWEVHVRDFSASGDSGMKNKGKYLAFTETGTTVNGDGQHPTGIDYLADLGVTHVHLLPVYDYSSVDETKLSTDQFNWGYDPMNYNTPEGSYSTDPYHGEVRVNEFKQMVQALHKKGIGVVMDVVYNHTSNGGSGKNDWFDFTVPGYYYRQDAKGGYNNGSGCGNETASDRAMYQKYMIDSLTYWATEYHLDGFRFDLMGIHDVDTMNAIRAALDKINPEILIYGEPWTAAATTCPKSTAVQGNMKLVSAEIAAFNDKSRDAIKGSCFNASDPGFIQGAGFEEALKGSIQANSTDMSGYNQWSKQPSQTVTYTSAHDNYTLYDKLVKSCKGGSGYGNRYDDLVAMNKLAGGIILTSQGMSFFQAGEEFARTKYGDENSYKSPTATNQLVWSNTKTYADLYAYYKGLIQIRKAYSPFRDPTNTSNGTIYFSWGTNCPANVVAFTMYNTINPGTEWDYVGVIHNSSYTSQTVKLMTYDTKTLPSQWVIIADGSTAGITSLGTTGSTVTVPARSTMVLVDKTSFDKTVISAGGKVTVNHVLKANSSTYKTETLQGKEGTAYSTSPLNELLNQGYKVSSVSGETTGTFTKAGTTVTYYYELDATQYSTVTVKYQDAESGASLAADDIKSGKIGTSYSVSPKTIKGYECDTSLTANATGTFAQGGTTVIFKYHEAAVETLKIHYYNSNGWSQVAMYVYTGSGATATQLSGAWPGTVMQPESSGWYVGSVDYDGTAKFIANNNNGGSQDPTGVGSDGYSVSGEVWVKGGKVYPTGKVNVRYTTQDGTVLGKETLKGIADGTATYTTSAKTFDGYTLVSSPSNASGLYTASAVTVTYLYKSTVTNPLVNKSYLSGNNVTDGCVVLKGRGFVVQGAAEGGTAPYQYRISVTHPDGATEMLQSYTTASAYQTALSVTGRYTFHVDVKDSSGTVSTKDLPLTVKSGELTISINARPDNPVVGDKITVYGYVEGGVRPYQFHFSYKKPGDSAYTTVKDYTSTAELSFTAEKAGTYVLRLAVKDAAAAVVTKTLSVTVGAGAVLTNNTTLNTQSLTLGDSVTVKLAASGGHSPYTYAVYYKKSSSASYTTVQSFNSNNSVTVKPGAATTYDIRTKVKDSAGTIKTKDFTVTVKNNALTAFNTVKSDGLKVTVIYSASGGTKPYQYALYYKTTDTNTYKAARSYTSDSTIVFVLPANGTYNLRTKVKDSTGTVVNTDYTVTVSDTAAKPTISATSITLGQDVTIKCAASGGTAPYRYAVYAKKSSSSSYTTVQDYSANTTVLFTPQAATTYDIRVKSKDKAGTVKATNFTLTVKKPSGMVNTSAISSTKISYGDGITITAGAAYGTSPYKYYIAYKKSSSSTYTNVQSYKANRTVSIQPGARTTYNILIKAKDSTGTVKSKTFTVTVS